MQRDKWVESAEVDDGVGEEAAVEVVGGTVGRRRAGSSSESESESESESVSESESESESESDPDSLAESWARFRGQVGGGGKMGVVREYLGRSGASRAPVEYRMLGV